jgi:hypothetical protein
MRVRADLVHVTHAERACQHENENGVEGEDVGHRRVPRLRHCHLQFCHEHGKLVKCKLTVSRSADLEHAPIRELWDTIRLWNGI